MKAGQIAELYRVLEQAGISAVVDGGWCVDALLGRQTRDHPDLDLAIERKDELKLKEWLKDNGFKEVKRKDTSAWNYVMATDDELLDIHVYEYDDHGNNVYGIEYPYGSLTGEGVIKGQAVRCIAPEWMFKFKTAYEPKNKDLQDVHALASKFGFKIPNTHKASQK